MPITDCFMELLFVFKHHKHLMTSLFLLLETLSGSFLNLGVEKTEVKTSGSFFCCYALKLSLTAGSELLNLLNYYY